MRHFIIIILLIISSLDSFSQELRCQIQIVHSQIQSTNRQLFENMRKDIYEFMNNMRWTSHVYGENERIECTIMITLSEQLSSDEFRGTLQVQSTRPIYNTSYNSPVLNFKERTGEFQFKYVEQQPIEFNETTYLSNLSSMLAFYAYIVIGMDYDTFSPEGGTQYYQKALTIVNTAQNSRYLGWKAFENQRNRYWLVENLTNPAYRPIRSCLYRFHRQGLDKMSEKTEAGRAEVAESLRLLQKAHRAKPNSYLMKIFLDAKGSEIVSLFKESFASEKALVYNILMEIDPANSSKYDKLIKN